MNNKIKRLDEGFLRSVPPYINLSFYKGPTLTIHGQKSTTYKHKGFDCRKQYLVLFNHITESQEIHWITSGVIPAQPKGLQHYQRAFASFYIDWLVEVKEFNPDYGFSTIFSKRINLIGENVVVKLHTSDDEEADIWAQVALEFQKKHDCNLTIQSKSDYIIDKYQDGVIPYVVTASWNENLAGHIYASYDIGRFAFDEYGANLSGHAIHYDIMDKANLPEQIGNRYPTTNLFASFKNPRNYLNQTSEEIAKDILGLSDWKIV